MNRHFYSRLAMTNIKKHKSIYLPYLLAGALIVALFYSLRSVSVMVAESTAKGSVIMGEILNLSSFICGFLSLVILFYINSFVVKRRKKEFGLYSILGMEKRHIAIVMVWEVLITGAVCILCGILGGALFSQLFFLLLQRIVGLPVELTFRIPMNAVLITVLLFGVGFALVLTYDIISIMRTNPISLLNSAKEGEREPKARWLLALIGLVTLGGGYVLSWMVRTPSDAIGIFFPAVLLVIIGTYCLFIAGSIVMLKMLRKNKNFYYKPQNFISVSGMIYRMKQNATGLSNICILSTCVLVTLSSSVCLYIGEEDTLRREFPQQVRTSCIADEQSSALMQQAAQKHAQEYGFTIKDAVGYMDLSYLAVRNGDSFSVSDSYSSGTCDVNSLLLEDYNRITGTEKVLEDGQVLVYVKGAPLMGDTIKLEGKSYKVAGQITEPSFISSNDIGETIAVVFPTFSDLKFIRDTVNANSNSKYERVATYYYSHDVSGDTKNLSDYYGTMRSALNETVPHLAMVDNIKAARDDFYQLYGSILFVGIFFVSLFFVAAVLIIYYKQITEGFDDHDRFRIMQNVGMSDKEVRSTIDKQVLMVFFLPLGMAVLHIAVAFPVLCKLLAAFKMTNTTLFLFCTIGAVVIFAILYFTVYQLTARAYYRILQAE
ncbi:MAG: FtsX-like permease family protein [Acetanaerobacterium sp.]